MRGRAGTLFTERFGQALLELPDAAVEVLGAFPGGAQICLQGGPGDGVLVTVLSPAAMVRFMVGSGNDCRAWSQPRLTLMT